MKLIQVGFLVLLWLMVLSVAAVMRGDLFARRRTKPPKATKQGKAARPVASAVAAAGAAAAAGAVTGRTAPVPQTAVKANKPPKPRRGAARTLLITAGARQGTSIELGAMRTAFEWVWGSPMPVANAPEIVAHGYGLLNVL